MPQDDDLSCSACIARAHLKDEAPCPIYRQHPVPRAHITHAEGASVLGLHGGRRGEARVNACAGLAYIRWRLLTGQWEES